MNASISDIRLHYPPGATASNRMAHECDMAIADLALESHFQPVNDNNGPYRLDIQIEGHRLVFAIKNSLDESLPLLILLMRPYRRLIQDYFLMIESYERVRIEGNTQKLEPIDMARRGLHDEAADLMIERLADKIILDHATARRLFTLVCALSI